MQDFIVWTQWISPIKYSLQAFVISEFRGTETPIVELMELDRPGTVSANIGVLLLWFILAAIGTILSLSMQREVR
jgi:hypothetical protein